MSDLRQQAVEAVRSRALFYFDVARDLRRARAEDDVGIYQDARILCFAVAGLFVLGGILGLLLPTALPASR